MKKVACAVLAGLMLSGCVSTELTPPPTDFSGNLPEELKERFATLNDWPPEGSRGEVRTFHFDSERSLLTVIHQLRSTRWQWRMDQSKVKPELMDTACEQFAEAIEQGLGVRFWYTGAGGFVSDPVSRETCAANKS
ncbi:hypothetical protein L4174_013375 [Photobacterium sp. CCB-ST2H9]|uniref:hypothetical protein n=1 Tax=unclassified Photobacterium TaxID=2628852 RepID=UPI002006A9DF|nr:hypothetical protein [Photobacterium sp. CCB-ST2H9]UTM56793.1 hypothetical protein L4174_013375 [Photobacterium sp. CCB-ST2H9]